MYRRQRRQPPDCVSLGDRGRGHQSDSVSVRSLDLRPRHGDRFTEDRRPAIMPRRSLMLQRTEEGPKTKVDFAEDRGKVAEARHLQQRGYLVIALSVVICAALLTWASYIRQRCDSLNMVTWDLASLKEDLDTKVVGQEHAVRQIQGTRISLNNNVLHPNIPDDLDKFASARSEGSLPVSVLIILGSSGVGKTFLADLIEHHFPIRVRLLDGKHKYFRHNIIFRKTSTTWNSYNHSMICPVWCTAPAATVLW